MYVNIFQIFVSQTMEMETGELTIFFKMFAELSTDGGQNWTPAINGPSPVNLVEASSVPEPSTLVLLSPVLSGMGFNRRKRL